MLDDLDFLNDATPDVDLTGKTREEILGMIHALVAEALVRNLKDPAHSTNPQILTAAMRFLKENDVSSVAVPGSPLAELSAHFQAPFKLKKA
jgi:hypothetical protein